MSRSAEIRLYLAGSPEHHAAVVRAVRQACASRFGESFELDVVDVLSEPERAAADRVESVPTLVQRAPAPGVRVVGDLLDPGRLALALRSDRGDASGP